MRLTKILSLLLALLMTAPAFVSCSDSGTNEETADSGSAPAASEEIAPEETTATEETTVPAAAPATAEEIVAEMQAAMKQAIFKILQTERYQYPVYSDNYGVELRELIGQPIPYVLPEIERRIREALMWDERITNVVNFDFDVQKNKVHVTFTANTVFGDLEISCHTIVIAPLMVSFLLPIPRVSTSFSFSPAFIFFFNCDALITYFPEKTLDFFFQKKMRLLYLKKILIFLISFGLYF